MIIFSVELYGMVQTVKAQLRLQTPRSLLITTVFVQNTFYTQGTDEKEIKMQKHTDQKSALNAVIWSKEIGQKEDADIWDDDKK